MKRILEPNTRFQYFGGLLPTYLNLRGPFFFNSETKKCAPLLKKWALDPQTTKNHVLGVKYPFFVSVKMANQFRVLFREKKWGCSTKKRLFDPQNTLKMHFSPKSLQNRFTFDHILSREVTQTIKSQGPRSWRQLWPTA